MNIEEKVVEKVFSTPARLRIVSALVASPTIIFSDMMNSLGLTRGNLSSHMKMLEKYEFVTVLKEFVNNRPQTSYKITELGRESFRRYVAILEEIISSTKE